MFLLTRVVEQKCHAVLLVWLSIYYDGGCRSQLSSNPFIRLGRPKIDATFQLYIWAQIHVNHHRDDLRLHRRLLPHHQTSIKKIQDELHSSIHLAANPSVPSLVVNSTTPKKARERNRDLQSQEEEYHEEGYACNIIRETPLSIRTTHGPTAAKNVAPACRYDHLISLEPVLSPFSRNSIIRDDVERGPRSLCRPGSRV